MKYTFLATLLVLFIISACKQQSKTQQNTEPTLKADSVAELPACCKIDSKSRFLVSTDTSTIKSNPAGTEGMVFIEGGTFEMGADNNQARADEIPKHPVQVNSFWMDVHEVTNAQFRQFVDETGYVTVAEQDVDWEVLRTQLPPGTPKPHDSLLVAGSMVFSPPNYAVSLNDYSQWWTWTTGANWKNPLGPGSSIKGIENHPVVHICYNDALAYCKWAGKLLPSEAEWEFAARGGLSNNIYPWGNEHIEKGLPKANSWNGSFPYQNSQKDGYVTTSPVKSYAPNPYGLYDMAGNIWEWTSDWYDKNYYKSLPINKVTINPTGPVNSTNSQNQLDERKAMRGGSFLCNDSYCSSYRVAARMPGDIYTGMSHTGFRCVKSVE